MDLGLANQSPKISGVLSNDHTVLGEAPFENTMIWLPTSADVQRMNRVETAYGVEPQGQLWGQAFIDEQSHAASAQGRPPGRPMSGCVRA